MSNNAINFKVFLRDENNLEARRFTVEDASAITNFMFMKEKLQMVFPVLREATFRVTWKDGDGDEITIVTDEDLITAYTEMGGNLKTLYVTILEKNSEPMFVLEDDDGPEIVFDEIPKNEGGHHGFTPRVICDGCNAAITGFRYKCLQCPDFDLCSTCEHKGMHSEHIMMRSNSLDAFGPRCGRRFMHHVMRSLKKAQSAAAKEACRSAKFAHKAFKAQEREEAKAESRAYASTSGAAPGGATAGASGNSSGGGTSGQKGEKCNRGPPPFGGACPMQNIGNLV